MTKLFSQSVLKLLELSKDVPPDSVDPNTLWVPDEAVGYRLCTIIDNGVYDVLVGFRDEQGFFEKKRVDKLLCEAPSFNTNKDDLCTLTEPNAATVLETLAKRYSHGIIHTYCGPFCVVVNPWKPLPPLYTEEVMTEYAHCGGDLPPHVYAIAQNAFNGIERGGMNQSILITGESGAGKTENTKKIIDFILHAACSGGDRRRIAECVVTSGQLLEAFGNAKTTHNSNSSRFGKFIRIEFDEEARLLGAKIECYLLEKSRVVNQNEGERNFHIFYQVLSNFFDVPHKKFLKLTKRLEEYKFLRTMKIEKTVDDREGARISNECFSKLGMSEEEQRLVLQVLSAILQIGNLKFGERTGLDISFIEDDTEPEIIAELLELKTSKLVDALTQPTIKVHDKLIRKNQNLQKTVFSACAMAKVLYERLFGWIVKKCNDVLTSESSNVEPDVKSRRFIAVLDIAGFEIIQSNSFEQFCINYTNERLQQFFNHFMFVKEQTDYLEEGVKWANFDFANDLEETISLIEKPLLSLLEEECLVPNGNDMSLLEKFAASMATNSNFAKAKQSQKSTAAVRHFLIKHYAGNVHYNIDGWVEKNRDHVETSVLELLSQSTNPLVKSLFPPVSTSVTKSRRGTLTTQSTVTYIYKNQLQSLLNTLNSSSAHFVRCVVPNHDRVPGRIDGQLVLDQLRCNGVLEAIRICRQGYPSRLPHSDFVARYKLLGGDELLINKTLLKTPKEACRTICQAVELDESRFCVGKTKMFCKVGVIAELESLRRARIANFITKFQAHARYGFAQKELESKRSSSDAVLTIQHNVRIFSKLSQWPWLRIFQLSRALIPRDRERLRIKELEKETMTLRDEIQELESRNQDTKQELDKLNLVLERERAGKETLNKSVEDIKKKLADKERQVRKTLAEMEQNEDVFSLLEKKYNEQHQKVMKMNDILREYERRAEQFDMEKADLEKELRKVREQHQREVESSEKTRKEVLEKMTIYDESQGQVTKLLEENSHFRLQIAKLENEVKDEKARNERQNNTIGDLQKLVTELNEKIARFDGLMLNEKNLMRRAERDKDQLKEELKAAKELIERQAKKIDQLKTHLTQRDNDVKRLERKLEDKDAMMKDCVQDLKESHKERVKELEQKMDDFKRRNSKLENENSMQKSQIETFERESSVDSDYGRSSSGRMSMSHIGRQYSLTSMGSFSSLRTIGLRRKDSESDLTSSMYSLRRRDSLFDLPTSPPSSQVGLQRSPSTTTTTSAVMEKERRIQELEKEKAALKTDLQLVRRELEVYKSQMTALEMEKESLQTMVRKQTSTLVDNTRQLNAAQKNVDNLELRLKRALDDSQVWKKKHEDSVSESKQEILAERKRASERTVAVEKENELKQSRISSVEMAKNELSVELTKAHAEIDRCRAIILQLEENLRSQETLGGSFESHQRNLQFEVESLRDENCALKAKIRRQYKQIEMLTHQDGTSDELAHFQQKLQRMEER